MRGRHGWWLRHDHVRRGRWATVLMGGAGRSVAEREGGRGGGCPHGARLARRRLLGRPRKEKQEKGKGGGARADGRKGLRAGNWRRGGEKRISFSFSNSIFQIHF